MIGRVHMNERLSDVTRMLLDVSVSQKKKKMSKKNVTTNKKKVTTNIKFYILIVFIQT